MFGLFKSSPPKAKVIDKVWMTTDAKWNAIVAMAKANPACVFVTWFEESKIKLEELLGGANQILSAEKADAFSVQDRMVVFAEHYPLPEKEETLFASLKLKEIPVMSSLDEPLFMLFGGEKTIELMKKLGMKEDEPVGHSMVTKAIRNAQRKLEEKIKMERPARWAAEWFSLNVHG